MHISAMDDLCYGWNKIWHGDVPRSSRLPQPIEFYALKNLTWWPIATWKIKKFMISENHLHSCKQNFSLLMHNSPPSLSAIKCTLTDNKAANINDKNCSLFTVLTSMYQKLK